MHANFTCHQRWQLAQKANQRADVATLPWQLDIPHFVQVRTHYHFWHICRHESLIDHGYIPASHKSIHVGARQNAPDLGFIPAYTDRATSGKDLEHVRMTGRGLTEETPSERRWVPWLCLPGPTALPGRKSHSLHDKDVLSAFVRACKGK